MKRPNQTGPDSGRSFRIVCRPGDEHLVDALLAAQGYQAEPHPLHPTARRLTSQPRPLGSSLAAALGLVYIQNLSSMLPPLALDPPAGARVLDMCASPGGKSSFLARLVGPGGLVVANEPQSDRLAVLRENLARMDLVQVVTCRYPGAELPMDAGSWRFILLDPPCSGWGPAGRRGDRRLWEGDRVAPLVELQRELLREADRLLAPGGRLVYSTCTTNPDENEAQVTWAAQELGLEVEHLAPPPGVALLPPAAGGDGALLVDGSGGEAEGFFAVRLAKPGAPDPGPSPAPEGGCPAPDPLGGQEGLPDELLPAWDRLPPGELHRDGREVRFLPWPAQGLDAGLRWRGMVVALAGKAGLRLAPRLRTVLPSGGVCLEHAAALQGLLGGQSLEWEGPAGLAQVPLHFLHQGRRLGLGWLRVKGRRVLWSEK